MARSKGSVNIDFWFCHILTLVVDLFLPSSDGAVTASIADKNLLLIWSCHLSAHCILLCFGYHVSDRNRPSDTTAESLSWALHDLWAYDDWSYYYPRLRIIHCPQSIPEKCSRGNEDATQIKDGVCHEHLKCISMNASHKDSLSPDQLMFVFLLQMLIFI